MRDIQIIIREILALLPDPLPADVADNITTFRAELAVIQRRATYTAPEAAAGLWQGLSTAAYRYMPPVTYAPWALQVSLVIQGVRAE